MDKFRDFNVKEINSISKFNSELKKCLLNRETAELLKKRGKWEQITEDGKFDMLRVPIANCIEKIIKKALNVGLRYKEESRVAIIGTQCSGKSELWYQTTPIPRDFIDRKRYYEDGLDEEGNERGLNYYTTHQIYSLKEDFHKNEDGAIILVNRKNPDDAVECLIEEKIGFEDYTKEEAEKEYLSQKGTIDKVLKTLDGNILTVEW